MDGLHFQLVGYFKNNEMKTSFKKNEVPEELMNVYNLDCHN